MVSWLFSFLFVWFLEVSMLLQKKTKEVNCIWKFDAVVEARTAEKCPEVNKIK